MRERAGARERMRVRKKAGFRRVEEIKKIE